MTRYLSHGLLGLFLLACIALGGASRAGFLANFALQVLALGYLGWGLYRLDWSALLRGERALIFIAAFGLVIIGAQFIPLTGALWSALPGRDAIAAELALLNVTPIAGHVTLSFHESVRSAISILPALAVGVFLLAARVKPVATIALTIIGATLVSLLVGILQFLGGNESSLYFYDFTNRGYMVGFFANANHMATLILIAIPFIAALLKDGRERFPDRKNEFTVLGLALIALYAIGVALVGSMTGYALLLPVTFASALIIWPLGRRATALIIVPLVALCAVALVFIGDDSLLLGSEKQASQAGRGQMFTTALPALDDFFPVGSGLGTFEEIYRRYEDAGAVTRTFINHAHNDYLEILIELGLPGLLLVVLFISWWLSCLKRLATRAVSPYAWAGWIAIGIILTHSVWDYPLRTAAISALFSVCCVLTCTALPAVSKHTRASRSSKRPKKTKMQL